MHIRRFQHYATQGIHCLLAALLLLTSVPIAGAKAENGQAFSISPPVIELKANPGQTITATIKLTNVSGGDLVMRADFNDFGAKDETGDPKILFDDAQSTTYSLKNWISAPAPFNMQSKETKSLTFPIKVPQNAEPGGHYAVIRFTGTAPDLQNGVALSASIGTLVLLEVSGNIKEDASVATFESATPNKFVASSFFENGPIGFVARIKNNGNVHVKPTGTIEVKNMFGITVASVRVNGDPNEPKNPPKSILPQSIRRFEETMPDQWMIGPYTATMTLHYGQGQKELKSVATFWVVPYKLIIILLLIGVVAFFVGRAGIRRYNASIIEKAQGGKPKQPRKSNKK
jgi:small neutral amino acid transporter SnatA (MarC family)